MDGTYIPVAALLDTGACVSLITEEFIPDLGLTDHEGDATPINIVSVKGNPIANKGRRPVRLKFGKQCSVQPLIVTHDIDLPTPILLGNDFMLQYDMSLTTIPSDEQEGKRMWELRIEGETIPIEHSTPMEISLISLADESMSCDRENEEETEVEILKEHDSVRCKAVEPQLLPPSVVGYITLVTPLQAEQALFDTCISAPQARALCSGIVKLIPSPDGHKSYLTIPYLNVENESIEIDDTTTLGFVKPVTPQTYAELPQVANIQTTTTPKTHLESTELEARKRRLYHMVDAKFADESQENRVLKSLIDNYITVFSTEKEALTVTPYYYTTIKQNTEQVVYRRPYNIPLSYHERVNEQLKSLEKQGIIRPSRSPFNAPLIPVPKKDGGLRLCLDFRALNKTLRDDRYPLPNITNILNQLGQSNLFSCLDLKQGYLQIPLQEEAKEKTAFNSPGSHWEFNSLPFGLKTAPAIFQKIINTVLTGLIGTQAFVYLDDIIILGDTFANHVKNLERVLERLRDAKLTIKMEKCIFFKEQVDYLGHVISKEGIRPQPIKIAAIQNIPIPQTVHDLQSFLGLTNYYRKFIASYSEIVGPLLKINRGKKGTLKKNDKTPLVWTDEARVAFSTLKDKMINSVTLRFPDFSKPFILTTDASNYSIGGVLQQADSENKLRPISFFSRKLNAAEQRYSTVEREALGVIYGLQANRPLILGYPIEIHTDHRPLVWLLQIASPNGRIARWQTLMSEYDFTITHIPGKDNIIADFMSRMKALRDTEIELIDPRDDMSGLDVHARENVNDQVQSVALVLRDKKAPENEESICVEDSLDWSIEEISKLQDEQPAYKLIKSMLKDGTNIHEIEDELKRNKLNVKMPLSRLQVENEVLYLQVINPYGDTTKVVVLPPEYIHKAISLGHSSATAGHGGTKVTLARCKKFCTWPGMKRAIEDYVRKCVTCTRFKRVGNYHPAPLRHYPDVTVPFERIHMDLVGPMGVSDNGYKYVLTIIDVLTRYLITVPLRSKEAREVAKALYVNVICIHGVPQTLVTDQGSEFVNSVMQEIASELLMRHAKITAYHPSANGIIERANYTIVNILRTMVLGNISIWDTMLPTCTLAYNTAYHRSIRESPFFLLFLRDPRMPYTMLESPQKPWYDIDSYKQEISVIAKKVYERCQMYLEEGREEMERNYKPSKVKPLKVGDRVFLKHIPTRKEPKKLQSIFDGPYRVVDKISDVVVKIRNLRTSKLVTVHTDRVKVLHEDCIDVQQCPAARRAYPFNPQEECEIFSAVPAPDNSVTQTNSVSSDNEQSSADDVRSPPTVQTPTEETSSQTRTEVSEPPQHRYSLRSSSQVQDLPNVMVRPLEYNR